MVIAPPALLLSTVAVSKTDRALSFAKEQVQADMARVAKLLETGVVLEWNHVRTCTQYRVTTEVKDSLYGGSTAADGGVFFSPRVTV